MKAVKYNELSEDFFHYIEIDELDSVRAIIEDVRRNGDAAIKEYTNQFDHVSLNKLTIDSVLFKNAYSKLSSEMIDSLKLAADNIERFARKQKEQFTDFEYEIQDGVFTGQKVLPIERIAVYTPGGRFPLPSTVLMCAIPAKVAGVEEIVLCSPPTFKNSIHPAILVAADMCGIDEIYSIGGVQAIAAMAYGSDSIRGVDKIVGPGNKYVAAAKKLVYGTVGIDFIAGPTEVLIIADETANPEFIAADLLAQAEHDTNAVPILITNSDIFVKKVIAEIEKQLSKLVTAEIAKIAIANNGIIILVGNIDEAVEISNRKAPEHLELQVKNPDTYIKSLKNYGSLFIGEYSVEALGDYSSGLNHTLPTNICARYTGGLSVKDFLKIQTTLRVNDAGLQNIGPAARIIGEMEGLAGHAKSVAVRLKNTIARE